MARAAPAPAAAALDARSFRDALGRFATGVAFVTAAPDGEPAGLIVNSLTSVSLEPPLVAVCPSRSSLTWSRMRRAGRFGINVLGVRHERFANARPLPARTDSLDSTGSSGTVAYRCSRTPSPPWSVRSSPSIPPAITGSS
jgi:flavin reductase (DIM6/NTAB) family NADH-FMN oxidoreductase RutF